MTLSPNSYWNIFMVTGGLFVLFFFLVVYPLAYFILVRPLDRRIKVIGKETLERGIPFFSWGVRVISYAWDIVVEPYRGHIIGNRVLARFVTGRFRYQERMYGKVDFRRETTGLQIMLAHFLTYGMIFFILYGFLFILHDFVLFREFAKARGG